MDCEICGFHRDLYTDGDLRTTLGAAPHLARHVLEGEPRDLQAELVRIVAPIADLPAADATGTIPMFVAAATRPGNCELRITALQGNESATEHLQYAVPAK